MAQKKHFTGQGNCKIHTARGGTCSKKKCDYRLNATALAYSPSQAHHILCVSCTIGYKTDRDYVGSVRAIDAVYRKTDWCVHQQPNMVSLPLKGTYLKKSQTGTKKNRGPVWSLNLPCHDWDHNCKGGYTDEVHEEFKRRVWDRIKATQQGKDCFTESDAEAELATFENDMLDRINDRGANREGGTLKAIEQAGTGTWWLPFSMAKDEIAQARVVLSFGEKPRSR